MGLSDRFIPHAVQLNTAGSVDAWINQIESAAMSGGVSLFEETSGSETDRQFVAEKEIMPAVVLGTSDLTALSTVGFGGVLINSGSDTPGAIIYARQVPLGSLPAPIGSSAHITCTVSDGLLIPQSLRAGHNEVAKLQLILHAILGTTPTYSGATPLVYAASQTIPSGSTPTENIYTAGPVKFTISGGSSYLVEGISQTAVDFGIQVTKEGTDGEAYPSFIGILSRMSKFEFTTKDPTLQAAIGDGVSLSAHASYFRNVAAAGQRVPAATTTHVKISCTAGMLTPGSFGLTHKRSGEAAYVVTPTLNSSLITISVASAIPTS